jgi:hypothetical protein
MVDFISASLRMYNIGKNKRSGIMAQKITIKCEAFDKNSDGSWSSVQITDIYAPIGAIRIGPGIKFSKGRTFLGVDLVKLLDQQCT